MIEDKYAIPSLCSSARWGNMRFESPRLRGTLQIADPTKRLFLAATVTRDTSLTRLSKAQQAHPREGPTSCSQTNPPGRVMGKRRPSDGARVGNESFAAAAGVTSVNPPAHVESLSNTQRHQAPIELCRVGNSVSLLGNKEKRPAEMHQLTYHTTQASQLANRFHSILLHHCLHVTN
jgi:hypothetical protein